MSDGAPRFAVWEPLEFNYMLYHNILSEKLSLSDLLYTITTTSPRWTAPSIIVQRMSIRTDVYIIIAIQCTHTDTIGKTTAERRWVMDGEGACAGKTHNISPPPTLGRIIETRAHTRRLTPPWQVYSTIQLDRLPSNYNCQPPPGAVMNAKTTRHPILRRRRSSRRTATRFNKLLLSYLYAYNIIP